MIKKVFVASCTNGEEEMRIETEIDSSDESPETLLFALADLRKGRPEGFSWLHEPSEKNFFLTK